MSTATPPLVHHVAVLTDDLDAAERFYATVLGLPIIRRWLDDAGCPRSLWLGLGGGAFIAVERATRAQPRRADDAPGWHCLAVGIASGERTRWRQLLAKAGFPVFRESLYTLYVRDPDGNIIGLRHYPEPAPGAE
jgi:glyoxylase I family protein